MILLTLEDSLPTWAVTTGKELQISPGDYEHDTLAISRLINETWNLSDSPAKLQLELHKYPSQNKIILQCI